MCKLKSAMFKDCYSKTIYQAGRWKSTEVKHV